MGEGKMESYIRVGRSLSLAAGLILSSNASIAHADSATELDLPRGIGALQLEMSTGQFERITGLHPAPCPSCGKDETGITLTAEQLAQFFEVKGNVASASLTFYNGDLYDITLQPRDKDVKKVRDSYTKEFKNSGHAHYDHDGASTVQWEDQYSLITVNFDSRSSEVLAIEYRDVNLSNEKDWRASLADSQTAAQ